MMVSRFFVAKESQPVEPDEKHPFVVLMRNDQPVSLVAYNPFTGNHPLPGAKTAAVLVVTSEQASSKEEYPKILAEAYILLHEAVNAEGVILVDEYQRILGVLSKIEILVPDDNDVQQELDQCLRVRSQPTSSYEPMASNEPHVIVSTIYVCPEMGCTCPDIDVYGWQKGREIPPCPVHNKPRQSKRIEVMRDAG